MTAKRQTAESRSREEQWHVENKDRVAAALAAIRDPSLSPEGRTAARKALAALLAEGRKVALAE